MGAVAVLLNNELALNETTYAAVRSYHFDTRRGNNTDYLIQQVQDDVS